MSNIYLFLGESTGSHGEGWTNCNDYAATNLSNPQVGDNNDKSSIKYMINCLSVSEGLFRGRKAEEDPVDLQVPKVPGVELSLRANNLPLAMFIGAMVNQTDINYKIYFWRVQHPDNTAVKNVQHNWMTWTGTRGKVVSVSQMPSAGADRMVGTADDMVFISLKATRYLWDDHDRKGMGQVSHENLNSFEVKHPHAPKPPSATPTALKEL